MKKIVILIAAASVLFAFLHSTNKPMKPVKTRLQEMVINQQTPSVQYIFFDDDNVIFEFRQGLAEIKAGKSVDPSTRYHLFSVTKTFTALAVMQLVQQDKVDLNKAIITYLPTFPYGNEVTVEQLLSHTAGLPNPLPLRWIHLTDEHSDFKRDAFFDGVFRDHPKLDYVPGSKFKYSNLGYVFLGQLVERVSGLSFEEYISRNITDRCGIDRSELDFTIDSANHATGYQKYFTAMNAVLGFMIDKGKFMRERQGPWKPFKLFYNSGIAYGGMFGTSRGLMRYAQTLIKPNSVLLDDSVKSILFSESTVGGKPSGMAHSWFTGQLNGQQYFAHAGGGGGYYVELRVYPQLRVGSLIMFNRTGVSDERLLDDLDRSFIAGRNEDGHSIGMK